MKTRMHVRMPDGSVYEIPTMIIARHRAERYKDEFGGDIERSLQEDTIPLFTENPFEIQDWASNNMNWTDVANIAQFVERPDEDTDFQEGWINGEKRILA